MARLRRAGPPSDPWPARIRQLADLGVPIAEWEPMRRYTTLRIGGPARVMVHPRSRQQLLATLTLAGERRWPIFLLGEGSKLLVHDHGLNRLVIATKDALATWGAGSDTASDIDVGAGVAIRTLARATATQGLSGLEFFAGVPGSVGGAVYMNAGGRGVDVGQFVDFVRVYDLPARRTIIVHRPNLAFGYRTSILQRHPWLALSARLHLAPQDPRVTLARMADFLARRHAAQPVDVPSAGSVFVNPPQARASILLDHAGVRGWRVGSAVIPSFHANFITNELQEGGATAEEVFTLMRRMHEAVRGRYGVHLRPEVIGAGFGDAWREAFGVPSR